jgi:peptidoglycan/LPS O-acetylase OafA/YrhL
MKMKSLGIESRVALVGLGACIIGFLHLAHLVPFTEQYETALWFLFGLTMLVWCVSPDRTTEAVAAIAWISFGIFAASSLFGYHIALGNFLGIGMCAVAAMLLIMAVALSKQRRPKSKAAA